MEFPSGENRAACDERLAGWLRGYLFAAVHVDHVARDPIGAGIRQGHDRAAEVGRRRKPVVWIPLRRDLDELLVTRDFSERRRVGYAAPQRIDPDFAGSALDRRLARMR